MDSPTRELRTIIQDSGDPGYVNRLLVATPTTGLVRIEWVQARYSQIIPVNWSMVQMMQYLNSYIPLRYQVADAQNLIVKELVEKDFEWLLLVEHDTMLPNDGFLRFDQYITEAKVPVVSGLYYTRGRPSYPLVFRGRGTGAYTDFEIGDKVFADGVPTGALLVHGGLLRAMWEEAPEYAISYGQNRIITRRVFDTPRAQWASPDSNQFNMITGTSDLKWCEDIIKGDFFHKSGWGEYYDNLPDQRYPFLVDTGIFCRHINQNGEQFP